MAEPDPNHSITLIAAIWRRQGKYLPAIACKQKPPGGYLFVAIKTPLTPWDLAVKAAQTAQLELMEAAAELEPPRTELEAFLFAFQIGYKHGYRVMMRDVAPADLVLRRKAELDEFILKFRPGEPEGDGEDESEDESEGGEDDRPYGGAGLAFARQILRRQKEGVPEPTILPLNPFEQLVLDAIEQLSTPRLRYVEGITAMARLLSGQDISQSSILETLNSLESRYVLCTCFADPSKFPDYAGRQYFIMIPIGDRSLKKARM